MSGKRWQPAEIELLESLVGFHFGPDLVRRYQKRAAEMGLPYRTPKGIQGKVWFEYGSIKPIYDHHSARSLARLLELPETHVLNWIHKGHLKVKRKRKCYTISNRAFEEFAMARPDLARKGSLDGLIFILGKNKAIAVKNSRPPKNAPQPVLYLVNGKVYPSICEAARQTHWSDRTIRDRLKKGIEWKKAL